MAVPPSTGLEGMKTDKSAAQTEDLDVKEIPEVPPPSQSTKTEPTSMSMSTNARKDSVVMPLNTGSVEPQQKSAATAPTTLQNQISTNIQKKPTGKQQKTLGDMTQEMKETLNKTVEELEKSDAEFNRLVGNVEKRIASLRLKMRN
ncbi:hypothetical protein JL09_g2993 [Pichia kudriavzevii]|uniref:Uncharacterized protein n=1 Tax=Pichia kudriavzevii TaxID=4909 RepID=A0A099P150_PICKU|nr:hypothetical protein JL09_g2993 [Pichia kudriavzevii]